MFSFIRKSRFTKVFAMGQKNVQGIDYAYTLQGWLKDINGYKVDIRDIARYDIGHDGQLSTNTVNAEFCRDAFSSMLQYHQSDYRPIFGNNYYNKECPVAVPLFNGNISVLTTDYYTIGANCLAKIFRYDKLNRIKQMETCSPSTWTCVTDQYLTNYSYDYNGNILTLQRYNQNSNIMHNISYQYLGTRNRLNSIVASGLNSSTYHYDAIGNLFEDTGENMEISWNAAGKVDTIWKNGNVLSTFQYSATGQRQVKKTENNTYYYIHDATGSVMCIYRQSKQAFEAIERPIYGAQRLGELKHIVDLSLPYYPSIETSTIGMRQYELTDHLGNVMATILDRRQPYSLGGDTYMPYIISTTDYYPFGYPIPNRSTNTGGYRYFFNGQEGDNEVFGNGGFQNYGFRMYDTRIARFWGVDPLTKDYPMLTPFQFASCSPILCVDVDGLEGIENTRVNMGDGVVHTYFNARQSTYVAPKWFTQTTLTPSELQMVSWSSNPMGEIKIPKTISRFELWLESPAKNAIDFTFKSLSNFGYSYVNSPYSLLFDKTISGSSLTPSQRMDAFVDFVPGVMFRSLTFSGQIIRTESGLKGYNKYIKESKEMGTLPSQKELPLGIGWQTEAGKMYQVNKSNQQTLNEANLFLKGINLSKSFIKKHPEQSQPEQ